MSFLLEFLIAVPAGIGGALLGERIVDWFRSS